MSDEDDAWAFSWMADHSQLEECTSARVTIDRITHRALNEDSTGWRTLCRSHKLWIRDDGFVLVGHRYGRIAFSFVNVDCLCCIPAGG